MEALWAERARDDFEELSRYIAQSSLQNADLVRERILRSVRLLTVSPQLGKQLRISHTRRSLPVPKTGFVILYRVTGQQVRILAIERGLRDRTWDRSADA